MDTSLGFGGQVEIVLRRVGEGSQPAKDTDVFHATGCFQGWRYGRASSLFASSSFATRCFAASHASVFPVFMARLARTQLAVDMYPCSISATGFPRESM